MGSSELKSRMEEFVPELPSPPKETQISLACKVCREKRSRCDREKPSCSQCLKRQSECDYNSAMSPKERLAASERVVEDLREQIAALEKQLGLSSRRQTEAYAEPPPVVQSPTAHLSLIRALEEPLDTFFSCIGSLFYITERKSALDAFIFICTSSHAQIPIATIVHDSGDLNLQTLASELAGMAAIGVVHFLFANPGKAFPIPSVNHLYSIARDGLDSAIKRSPFRAMKVAALLAMYNIMVHATVALTYAELGLNLARNQGFDYKICPPGMSAEEFKDHKRTHRTLVYLQCWISASLNRIPQSPCLTTETSFNEIEESQDAVRQECVKITVIKAKIHHQIPVANKDVAETTVANLCILLSTFYAQLPHWMGLNHFPNPSSDSSTAVLRPVVFSVHLLYLSAMMLLGRRLCRVYIPPAAAGRILVPQQAKKAIQDGFVAAQTSAQVLGQMLSEGKVVQACWLCIFTAYTAGIMVAYMSCQKALGDSKFAHDLKFCRTCVEVLAYCSQRDESAQSFHDSLNGYFLELLQHAESLGEYNANTATEELAMNDVLFVVYSRATKLHCLANDLLQIIHQTFSGMPKTSSQAIFLRQAESIMGTHLEWKWELDGFERSVDCPICDPGNPMHTATEVEKPAKGLSSPPQYAPGSTLAPPITLRTEPK